MSMQSQYNLISREEEREMTLLAADASSGLTPWSPFARGKLTRDWIQTTARTETDLVSQALYAQAEDGDRAVAAVVADVASLDLDLSADERARLEGRYVPRLREGF
ncbi:hypothetical protein [Cryobacterium glaciale]|uniref:hypothetical protein n=1 Tax=Cryobacterium glaciale TaxID=1259145 RepID=UPI001583EA9B|nr:hypothetical protein [Cryobacterium glaciale]